MSQKEDENIENQVSELQSYKEYGDIIQTFDDIENRVAVDPSLIMEWNTWKVSLQCLMTEASLETLDLMKMECLYSLHPGKFAGYNMQIQRF